MILFITSYLLSCHSAEELYSEKRTEKTLLYVYNNLNHRFFALIEGIYIRESNAESESDLVSYDDEWSENLLLKKKSNSVGEEEKITVIEGNFWKTELASCDVEIDLMVHMNNNEQVPKEIYEYQRLPVKCGESYKFVISEPTSMNASGNLEGCMQTSSEASRSEDSRIKERCGIGAGK